MASFFGNDSSSVTYFNPINGIQFDGHSYALYDPNFKILSSFSISFEIQTFSNDGMILWVSDPVDDSSFTIEIQNQQITARAIVHGQPFSVRTNFTKKRLCDGKWHCVQIRLDSSLLTMKVDKRQYTKSEARVPAMDLRGPLFIGGHSERYSPSYLSVRTRYFLLGNIRNLKINDKVIEWLAPRPTAAKPNYFFLNSNMLFSNNEETHPDSQSTDNKID